MKRKALVIGYGSIGTRHARVLKRLDFDVAVVSRRGAADGLPVFATLEETRASSPFDYIVIADETQRHACSLAAVADSGHTGLVLVEKPLFASPAALPAHHFLGAGVGYNLRFHPAVEKLRAGLVGRTIQMAHLHVGQWLGDWRLGREVATCYSASRGQGGGVLRDLSHELDLALWLFGPWHRVVALGGRLGTITVDADDGWGILLDCQRCPLVTIHLDAFDRKGRRAITVQADGETLCADLVAGTLEIGRTIESMSVARDTTFQAMHEAVLSGSDRVCSLEDGLRVVDLVAAIERSSNERRWVEGT